MKKISLTLLIAMTFATSGMFAQRNDSVLVVHASVMDDDSWCFLLWEDPFILDLKLLPYGIYILQIQTERDSYFEKIILVN